MIYTSREGLLPKPTIFLAGPSIRGRKGLVGYGGHRGVGLLAVTPWRAKALELIHKHKDPKFRGHILVPEPFNPDSHVQRLWETEALQSATAILMWIPRDLDTLPGFTTNIEFGEWLHSRKLFVGAPVDTPKTGYIYGRLASMTRPFYTGLEALVAACIHHANNKDSIT